jgi:hypothetical protein
VTNVSSDLQANHSFFTWRSVLKSLVFTELRRDHPFWDYCEGCARLVQPDHWKGNCTRFLFLLKRQTFKYEVEQGIYYKNIETSGQKSNNLHRCNAGAWSLCGSECCQCWWTWCCLNTCYS